MKKRWMRKAPIVIGIAAVAITAMSGAVMLLWNGILTSVLHVGTITLLQAAGILLLSKILFGGFKGRHMGGWRMRQRMFMKWDSMTVEEKEQIRSKMHTCRGRFGRGNEAVAS